MCAESMMAFHRAESAVLLSTDVAARGLDFPAVTHILQFDPPGEAAEYVQRVGRTARMGKRGAHSPKIKINSSGILPSFKYLISKDENQ